MKKTRDEYIAMLQEKAAQTGRYPRRSDFDESDVMYIKAIFGPWRYALEEAKLLEPKKAKSRKPDRQT